MGTVVIAILPVVLQLLEQTPALIGEVQQLTALLKSNNALTADQQAQIDAALDAAHQALQVS